MNFCKKIFILILFLKHCIQSDSSLFEAQRHRRSQARTLTFPATAPTRVQFIGGIGIPVEDLLYEAVTSGYVLKAEYFLPEKAKDFTPNYLRPQRVHRRNAALNETLSKSEAQLQETNNKIQQNNKLRRRHTTHDGSSSFNSNLKRQQKYASTYRWVVYRAIEVALTSSNLPGKACLLRSICEHAAAPMHYGAGILAELLHIILTPSTSSDQLSSPLDKEYLQAENIGYTDLISGIGIPVEDLLLETVTSGFVLKPEYFLPNNAEDFTTSYLRPQRVHRHNAMNTLIKSETLLQETNNKIQQNNKLRRRHTTHDGSSSFNSNLKSQQKYASTYRWVVYRAIEVALTSWILPGKACLLSICEHAAALMHYGAGILVELLHIILTPSTSSDLLSSPLDKEYLQAENIGYTDLSCKFEFKNCTKSTMDLITAVFDLNNLYF